MRWTINPRSRRSRTGVTHDHDDGTHVAHDARQVDLLCIIALLIVIVGAWRYLADTTTMPPTTTSYIVPSQTVHW
ncbi:hypothetical protein SSBR45G_27330 [Bradyrhizobium sp. SSBR45G]|uniref:hypothetical protein n=1 Tax=unclassified Bradyrhizobium TaxID=2631580 RepID=UPI002342B7BC|nr:MULTISPECIES: hypothetical protein [unclassified Bradyrhizobium]GLH77825.1 hypothetical protein SSBR45G_27330 [Bradyrhizobium sp. SSBR45G]GLH85554.1 hypothetical protein SSBR45R_30140 [Bradyrhizobium sp. SSBR45R]